MKIVAFSRKGVAGLALQQPDGSLVGCLSTSPDYPGDLVSILARGDGALTAAAAKLADCAAIDQSEIRIQPPLTRPGKIICVGLNYVDHASETGFVPPAHATVFARFSSGLVGHGEPLVAPSASSQFDFEGELVAVIGRKGKNIAKIDALDHVAGYSLFNDGSVRDFQFMTSQRTLGKNFDATGGFGPAFVSADALPPGCKGLTLTTRLNGKVVQQAPTNDMIFDVAELVMQLSRAFTLEPGDMIVTGTPAGVGMARNPPLFLKEGDVCEVDMDGIGVLRNSVIAESN